MKQMKRLRQPLLRSSVRDPDGVAARIPARSDHGRACYPRGQVVEQCLRNGAGDEVAFLRSARAHTPCLTLETPTSRPPCTRRSPLGTRCAAEPHVIVAPDDLYEARLEKRPPGFFASERDAWRQIQSDA